MQGFLFTGSHCFFMIQFLSFRKPKIMKQILLIISFCVTTTSLALGEKPVSVTSTAFTESERFSSSNYSVLKKKPGILKLNLKERLIQKWLVKKLSKKQNGTRSVNSIGLTALVFAIIAVLSLFVLFVTDLEVLIGLFFVAVIAGLLALIFSIMSLVKRSQLKDKSGTKSGPAIAALVLIGLLGILLFTFLIRLA